MMRAARVAAVASALAALAAINDAAAMPPSEPSALVGCADVAPGARARLGVDSAAFVSGAPRRQSTDGPGTTAPVRTVSTVSLAQGLTTTTVMTHVHVMRSPGGPRVSRARILDQIDVLNSGFGGRQSRDAAVSPYRFKLASLTRTVSGSWDHMTQGSMAERRAKKALHRGDANDLNLYIVARTSATLGWSSLPQQYGDEPRQDGVVVARTTLPGGSVGRYSAGDVAVHETGHWLGLLHTFAGKCGRDGDLVADTPAEARPSYTCPVGRDTCSGPGKDPVRNFMDYSYDSCMNHFTQGQVDRMSRMWGRFRADGGV